MSKKFRDAVWKIAADARAAHGDNIDLAVGQAAEAIQALPEYSAWVARMVEIAIRQIVRCGADVPDRSIATLDPTKEEKGDSSISKKGKRYSAMPPKVGFFSNAAADVAREVARKVTDEQFAISTGRTITR